MITQKTLSYNAARKFLRLRDSDNNIDIVFAHALRIRQDEIANSVDSKITELANEALSILIPDSAVVNAIREDAVYRLMVQTLLPIDTASDAIPRSVHGNDINLQAKSFGTPDPYIQQIREQLALPLHINSAGIAELKSRLNREEITKPSLVLPEEGTLRRRLVESYIPFNSRDFIDRLK